MIPLRAAPLLFLLSVGVVNASAAQAASRPEANWRTRESDHFVVFYASDASFALAVLREGERLYDRLNVVFGFDRMVKSEHLAFWLWEDRCEVYLYGSRREYVESTGAPPWSAGRVNYRERILTSYEGSEEFLTSTLPHEMAHILFREAVGFGNRQVPRWLDEGIAQVAEEGRRAAVLQGMAEAARVGQTIPLAILGRVDPARLDGAEAQLFYAQAASLIHFFLESYGTARFVDLCRNLRDGYNLDRALSFATGSRIADMDDLERAWKRYLGVP